MDNLRESILALSNKNFFISIEDGREIPFYFKTSSFYHLLGLHYLEDLPHISKAQNKGDIIKRLMKSQKLREQIERSAHYSKIKERMESFFRVNEMLLTKKCEIIIDFDKTIAANTKIQSQFLLYITEDRETYYILGIAQGKQDIYYPETFIVEHSKYYVTGQTFLFCEITSEEYSKKKAG